MTLDLVEVATEAARYFETARRATGDTETGPREDRYPFVRLTDDAPEWVMDLVREAHCGMFPDDWRYACIRDAVDWIAEGNEDDSGAFADSQVDVYTCDRLKWLESLGRRVGYCDDAIDVLHDEQRNRGRKHRQARLSPLRHLSSAGAARRCGVAMEWRPNLSRRRMRRLPQNDQGSDGGDAMSGRGALIALVLAVCYLVAITHGIPHVIDGR